MLGLLVPAAMALFHPEPFKESRNLWRNPKRNLFWKGCMPTIPNPQKGICHRVRHLANDQPTVDHDGHAAAATDMSGYTRVTEGLGPGFSLWV